MTVTSTLRTAGPYIGNGAASSFPFAFKVFEREDVKVVRREDVSATEAVLVLDADYTVTLSADQDANPGGSVTLLAGALASGYQIVLTSDIALLQETLITNQGGFYPRVFNDVFDRLMIVAQQLQEKINRAFLTPITANLSAPEIAFLQSGILRWNVAGTDIEAVAPATLFGDDLFATSATSNAITGATGLEKTFTLNEDNRRYGPGSLVNIVNSASVGNFMSAVVKSYNPVTDQLVALILSVTGSGTGITTWSIVPNIVGGVPVTRQISVAGGMLSGGGTFAADRTITLTPATTAEIRAGTNASHPIAPDQLRAVNEPVALTAANSISWNHATQGPNAELTLGNFTNTLAQPTNFQKGETTVLAVTQDSTPRDMAFAGCYIPHNGVAFPDFSADVPAGEVVILTFYCYVGGGSPKFRVGWSLQS